MDWRPLTSRGGIVTDVKFDNDGRIIVRSRQDVDPILDHNKTLRNHGQGRKSAMGDLGRHIATIPNSIVHKWLQEGINVYDGEHQAELARKLNDPDWRYLRTNPGHIGVSNGVAR
jgi:hypothetical protein